MLTLKLRNSSTNRVRIVECDAIDIVPDGNDVLIVTEKGGDISAEETFRVSLAGDFDVAYIENAQGSTTQVVRAGGNR